MPYTNVSYPFVRHILTLIAGITRECLQYSEAAGCSSHSEDGIEYEECYCDTDLCNSSFQNKADGVAMFCALLCVFFVKHMCNF